MLALDRTAAVGRVAVQEHRGESIVSTSKRVAIVGQGYVGLPLAVAAAQAGHTVVGIDLAVERVADLNAGRSPVGDVTDADLDEVLRAGSYRASDDFGAVAEADVVVLCVPTPYHNDAPDLSYVEAATTSVAAHLAGGALVILESTTYPGTTEEVLVPILEAGTGGRVGEDFHLVFSPERIDPGNERFGMRNTPKVVGGTTPEATALAAEFYGSFVDQVVTVSGPATAEAAKLLENTFRHLNIALVNELAVLFQELGLDVWEVIEAASSKPFGFMPFYPGPGVGGHCIPVDPMYLSWRVRQLGGAAKFIELAQDVNTQMPLYVVSRIQELLNEEAKPVKGSRVLVLGVAYKRDIADMRESPALPLLERLVRKGADVRYHDPYVPTYHLEGVGELKSVELDEAELREADCVVVVTDHSSIDYDMVAEHAPLVFDTRNRMPRVGAHIHRL
jgi:UDP-N-acetyl-D-glucosamine dehydrogenase